MPVKKKYSSVKTSAKPTTLNSSDEPRKLTKQEKRNLKKKEKQQAEGQLGLNANRDSKQQSADSSRLSAYKRLPVYPKSYPMPKNSAVAQRFVEAHHKNYKRILETCYDGFVIQNSESFERSFHDKFQQALRGLEGLDFYQFDLTQPAGLNTKIAKTFVTRCLVGEPGMTYKYLGLRMFAFPWTAGTIGSNEHTVAIGELNNEIIERSNNLNIASGKDQFGSSQFNLTLINRCFPEDDDEVVLKKEPMFEKDKLTVSWHADSSLDHYSTIAVYHFNECSNEMKCPWRIALRVQINAEGPQQGKVVPDLEVDCPPVAVSLPNECCYYMLDDFNHHHQHAVLVGGSHRFASTHRVSRKEGHSYQYLHQRIQSSLHEKISADCKTIRKLFLIALELEFEWLRQFYIQGKKHHDLHQWWHAPMEEFRSALTEIDLRLAKICRALVNSADKSFIISQKPSKDELKMQKLIGTIEAGSLNEMVAFLNERLEKRKGWESRESDPIFDTVEAECRPMPVPLTDSYRVWEKLIKDQSSISGESEGISSCRKVISALSKLQSKKF